MAGHEKSCTETCKWENTQAQIQDDSKVKQPGMYRLVIRDKVRLPEVTPDDRELLMVL
jgi:hypothetical protein